MLKTINKINRVDEIAAHYGFKTMRTRARHIDGEIFLRPEEKISVLENYSRDSAGAPNDISMIYHNHAILTNNRLKKQIRADCENFNFDIIGAEDSIAEATIIHTALTVLNEAGFKNIFVDINSIGDRKSFLNFKNELFDYYKNQIHKLHPNCRNFHKTTVLDLLSCPHKECQTLKTKAPKPIYFLSRDSQSRLKKILEYLESMGINYRLNDFLMGRHNNHFSKIIFEIKTIDNNSNNQNEELLLGRGGRYDELAKKIIRKKNVSAVGVSLDFKPLKNIREKTYLPKKPKFYFIQFGEEAKLKSLPIIELFRDAAIPIQQNLYANKFSEQMDDAKN